MNFTSKPVVTFMNSCKNSISYRLNVVIILIKINKELASNSSIILNNRSCFLFPNDTARTTAEHPKYKKLKKKQK